VNATAGRVVYKSAGPRNPLCVREMSANKDAKNRGEKEGRR
jgi:hypothetical protein